MDDLGVPASQSTRSRSIRAGYDITGSVGFDLDNGITTTYAAREARRSAADHTVADRTAMSPPAARSP